MPDFAELWYSGTPWVRGASFVIKAKNDWREWQVTDGRISGEATMDWPRCHVAKFNFCSTLFVLY